MLVLSVPSHMPATLLVASYQLPYLISQPEELIITLWKDWLLEFCILNHQRQVNRGGRRTSACDKSWYQRGHRQAEA